MEYNELKKLCLNWIKDKPEYKQRLIKELSRAKIAYDNKINLVDELNSLKASDNLSDGYIIPAILGLTKTPEVKELKSIELKQVKAGGGGGLDIDTDISTAGKPLVKEYLEKKYGKDHILSVGTFATIGLASAIKDILRKQKVEFSISNKFCSYLDPELSFEENMENYKKNYPDMYNIYLKYKLYLDFVPKFSTAIRSCIPYYGLVNTDKGKIEICKLNPGQYSIAYITSNGTIAYTRRYTLYFNGRKDVFEIKTNEKSIRATTEHQFFTTNGIKEVKDLKIGDEVFDLNLNHLKIISINKVDNCDVFDIKNKEENLYKNEPNFICDDILVHNCGKHAGGVLILPKSANECVPVIRAQGELASAFVESGNAQNLDEMGIVKYDLLAISQLDLIDNTLDISDGFYKIEDDDGIIKIVSKAYLMEKGITEEEIEKIK